MTVIAARVLWVVSLVLSVVSAVASLPGFYAYAVSTEDSALAHTLAASGDQDAGVIVATLMLAGIATQTTVFLGAAAMLARIGWREALPLVISAALVAYSLGLGLEYGAHPGWLQAVHQAIHLIVVTGLCFATLTFPDGRFASTVSKGIAAIWLSTAALLLYPVLIPGWDGLLHTSVNLPIQLGFLIVGVGALAWRYQFLAGAVTRIQMRWVVYGFVVGAAGMGVSLGLGEGAWAELYRLLIYPLLLCVAPLAVTSALVRYRVYDLPEVLRRSAVVGVSVGVFGLVALVLAEGAGLLARALLAELPPVATPVIVLGSAAVFVWVTRGLIAVTTDQLMFPGHVRSVRAIAEANDALDDCIVIDEVRWVAESALAAGWRSRITLWRRVDSGWRALGHEQVIDFADHVDPQGGLQVLPTPNEDVPPAIFLPVRFRGELVGGMLAEPPRDGAWSDADQQMVASLSEPLGAAIWRVTIAREQGGMPAA